MATIGIHASHELYSSRELLGYVKRAQAAGFSAGMCSDHFHPWTERQGDSGFAWSWLGAALEGTNLSFGTVCAPGQRYHPAIIAQGAATLAQMYPNRFWLAVGTGQALNESITGDAWPDKAHRRARLMESVYVMRSLWAGEEVTHHGRVHVHRAKLYSRPERPPMIVGAAITENTAEWVGGWADALITVGKDPENLRKVIRAFRDGGGEGKPMFLQAAVAYGETDDAAAHAAHQRWPVCGLEISELEDLPNPHDFGRAVSKVTLHNVMDKVRVSADLGRHIDWLVSDFELGFEAVYLHNIGGDMHRFIDVFSRKVLPKVLGA